MIKKFKLWSDVSRQAKAILQPELELRAWNDLIREDKKKITRHLMNLGWIKDDGQLLVGVIIELNQMYKVNVYGKKTFEHFGPHRNSFGNYEKCCIEAATQDFVGILLSEEADAAIEVMSLYSRALIGRGAGDDFSELEKFCRAFNELAEQFSLNLRFSRQGPRIIQEKIVDNLVLEPIFTNLSGEEWEPVQSEFRDAMSEYRRATGKGYSASITHIVSAVQAYLQILINGNVGKDDISTLIAKGQKSGLIPDDQFSREVMGSIKSTLMELRQSHGNAHPKKEYANEQHVRLALNIAAVFIQHCSTFRK